MNSNNLKESKVSNLLEEFSNHINQNGKNVSDSFFIDLVNKVDKETFELFLSKIDKTILSEENKEHIFGNILILNKYGHALSFFKLFPVNSLDEVYLTSSLISEDIDKVKELMSMVKLKTSPKYNYLLNRYLYNGNVKGVKLLSSQTSTTGKINLLKLFSDHYGFRDLDVKDTKYINVKLAVDYILNSMPHESVLSLKSHLDLVLEIHPPNIITDVVTLKIKQINDEKVLKEGVKPSAHHKSSKIYKI